MKSRWVLTTKYHIDDTVAQEKARLVVKGFTQVYSTDYNKTYAPMSSYDMLRIFLSFVVVHDLNLMQLDMNNAFLQSKLDRVMYMYQPDYYNDGTGRVCKLLKSLYGLKQSPRVWYKALNDVLVGDGWKKSNVNEGLYFKVDDDGVACWVLVYVNDLLATSSSTAILKEPKELLDAAFELREISPVEKHLELEIVVKHICYSFPTCTQHSASSFISCFFTIVCDRPARKLWLHQQGYADKLRTRFVNEEQTGRIPTTPVSVDAYAELTFDDEDAQECKKEEFQQKVGSLQFAATTTRPDIDFACSKLRSGLMVRSDQHWHEVDRCLAYLADTRDTDNVEAEYMADTKAGKEGRRICFLLTEFRLLDVGKPTILRVDNKSAIIVATGLGLQGNLKHMEWRYAWLWHMVKCGKFTLKYIPTTEQPADFLTKALHFSAFNQCSVAIGQVRLADVDDGDDDVQQ
ncbi:unnamed protein product [Closterium sp. NIES-54]